MKRISLVILSLGLSACSMLTRHPGSGYDDNYGSEISSPQRFYDERDQFERDKARDELGYETTRPLSEGENARLMRRLKLKRLEQGLESNREKSHYYGYKPFFRSDAERVYFLGLPSVEARDRWARSRSITTNESAFSPTVALAIEKSDITVGMSKKAVKESWGDPDIVEVAGNIVFGNERWKYAKMVSTSVGYNREMRIIYFESGRVVGWEKQ